MSIANLGARNANLRAGVEMRLLDLERSMSRLSSRPLVASAGYSSRRIAKSSHGWSANTWIMRDGGSWSSLAASDDFTADMVGVVLRVVDADTVEVVFGGIVQLIGTSYANGTTYYASTSAGTATATPPTAPNVTVPLFDAFEDGWILLHGQASVVLRSQYLADLLDVDQATVIDPNDGDLLSFDLASGTWKAVAGGAGLLGTRTALSVFGNPTNSAATGTDIVAAGDNQVLQRSGTTLVFTTVGTNSIANGAVTAVKIGTDVVLDTLNDVTITAAAAKDFLRRNAAGTAWVNENLGDIAWVSASRTLVLDGGSSASAASKIGIGKAGSRFLAGIGSAIEWVLSGDPDVNTEICARIRSTAATDVSFYDQATSTFGAGDLVMQWGTNSTAASRYFRFAIPLHVQDTGTKNLVVKGTTTQTWTIGDDVGPSTFLTLLGTSADSYGRRVKLGCDIDNGGGGFTFYGDRSNGTSSSRLLVGATDGNWNQSGNLSLTAGGAVNLIGTGTSGVQIGASGTSDKIGFWGHAGVTKTTVADPAAITTSQTAGGTYTANEQAMLAALKADVIALRATLLNVTDAGQACGLF